MTRYYDRDGQPIDLKRWGELLEDPAYHFLRQDFVRGWWVCTEWLGLDTSIAQCLPGYTGPPLTFETKVHPLKQGYSLMDFWYGDENYLRRYPTEPLALAGHDETRALIVGRLGADDSEVLSAERYLHGLKVPDSPEGILIQKYNLGHGR